MRKLKKRIFNFFRSTVGWALTFGILLSIVLPIVLPKILPYVASLNTFTKTGSIGDTIGGIAGPILNLTGLILVYFSFQQQMHANKKQWKAFKIERDNINEENLKFKQEEVFDIINKSILLLAQELKLHEPTFRAITQVINQIENWYEAIDEDDFLQIKALQRSIGFHWHNRHIKNADDSWLLLNEFDIFARYFDEQFVNIYNDINNLSLTESKRHLLKEYLNKYCIVPTYNWLPDETLQKLWDRDEHRFQQINVSSTINVIRAMGNRNFPSIIEPSLRAPETKND